MLISKATARETTAIVWALSTFVYSLLLMYNIGINSFNVILPIVILNGTLAAIFPSIFVYVGLLCFVPKQCGGFKPAPLEQLQD